ncbi:nickel/cobalt efflux transporter [Acidomonas methanolica]|uniref:Nickel/cobalt efflux system n=1 Tax=Acidomonas methanolica NBRC 104435 TaxID=1231351 RepID=A0A023D9Q2_ACIMT|nr:nickel/cobalt efflux transporter [Acidomonas methanolica]MBU2655403.1 nickel/cobalt efflux transporter RcnA [Acidomonas methanolica]TCS23490.1 nickel/cobalt exporter [Acidomonas methanolica]GAJ30551.1 Ni-resistant membrane protein NcrC [Acidomonas methanolica NBRC 104435]GBQ46163.1 putative transporter [Acidomonas methanolica]GEL00292.1 nickel/cobalt efflux system [Acidomonas methanolica NBRC 104435]
MQSLPQLLQQDATHTWLFIPTAILLGALHGLEPGHSKTMMAAFIIAIRGTVAQAILLGVSAALSHTAIVWVVALGGQYLGRGLDAEAVEPYLQLVSAVIIAGIAAWMIWRIRHGRRLAAAAEHHDHEHHDHGHHHGGDVRRIDTGHGVMALEVFEEGVPPRWRIRFESGHGWAADDVSVVTERADASTQVFAFVDRGGYLESREDIPEPHAFMARVRLGHGGHTHDYDVPFVEGHGHDHLHEEVHGLNVVEGGAYIDAHERAHADDISRRFRDRNVTTAQIILFGLTGGLIPCPAAITVLLLCLQLKQWMLGVALVGFFSVGLAVTMVTAGVVASLSVRQVRKRWSGFGALARRAPYASGVLMLLVALYMAMSGLAALASHHAG